MTLQLGEPAPDFALKNQHGELVTLSHYRGSANVLIVFYPFAFSNVCTGELARIQAELSDLTAVDAEVLAVSCDAMYALRVFADQQGLTFSVLSDFWPHGETARAYGTFNERIGAADRGTFIVDRAGVLRWQVHNELGDARDVDQYRKALTELR